MPSEITSATEVGFVTTIRDFLIYLDGLPTVRIHDLVESETGVRGWVNAIMPDKVEVMVMDDGAVKPGQMFKRVAAKLQVNVGEFLLGRAVNSLGVPIDGKGLLGQTKTSPSKKLDRVAPGISERVFIDRQFETGITSVDTLIPIGKGQRQLVLGDARSGKTSFLTDLLVAQKSKGIICIYGLIGKPIMEVRSLIDTLRANEALSYTTIIAAASSDPAPLIYLAPQIAFTVAEYFQSKGKDVLVILDDMGAHAKIYREMALLGGRSPGRESYPGDIFYQQAHLLERAGNFKASAGGGSITALPVMELDLNDFTTYIPTNLMAMTDGHFLFRSSLFNTGQRPAIDLSLSVSRIGQQTQNRVQNLIAARVKRVLAQARDLETVSRFNTELPLETQQILTRSRQILDLLKQEPLTSLSAQMQTIILGLSFTAFFQDKPVDFAAKNKDNLINAFNLNANLSLVLKSVFDLKDDNDLIFKLEAQLPEIEKALTPK